VGVNWAVWP